MQVSIIGKGGKVLPSATQEGQVYVQAPKKGAYKIRVRNPGSTRRLAIISVDGINVVNGETAGHDGPGYVIKPFETVDIPGFRRDDGSVAEFKFAEQGESYAAQTGKGTSNVGVIGVAFYDEKVRVQAPIVFMPFYQESGPSYPGPSYRNHGYDGTRITCATNSVGADGSMVAGVASAGATTHDSYPISEAEPARPQALDERLFNHKARKRKAATKGVTRSAPVVDVGTKYGKEVAFRTTTTEFERASHKPFLVEILRYATKERLKTWGIVFTKPVQASPNPFPASQPSVPAPPNWGS